MNTDRKRNATLLASLLLSTVFPVGCGVAQHHEDEKVIADAIDGIDLSFGITEDFYTSGVTDTACFESNKLQETIFSAEARKVNGFEAGMGLRFNIDPVAAMQTVTGLAPVSSRVIQGRTLQCFNKASLKTYAPSPFSGPSYQITLGTLHIQKTEFVNEFSGSLIFGTTLERSYHVFFTIDPPKDADATRYPNRFEVTCVIAKNAVENVWVLAQC